MQETEILLQLCIFSARLPYLTIYPLSFSQTRNTHARMRTFSSTRLEHSIYRPPFATFPFLFCVASASLHGRPFTTIILIGSYPHFSPDLPLSHVHDKRNTLSALVITAALNHTSLDITEIFRLYKYKSSRSHTCIQKDYSFYKNIQGL